MKFTNSVFIVHISTYIIKRIFTKRLFSIISAIIFQFSGILLYNRIFKIDTIAGIGIYSGLFNLGTIYQTLTVYLISMFSTLKLLSYH